MMKKSLVVATAMFAAVVGFQPVQQAEAKVKLNVQIGVPGGYYGGGYYGGGYYGGGYYGGGHGGYYGGGHGGGYGRWAPRRISCARGRRIVRNSGYRFVVAIDCRGSTYKFKGTRGGARFLLKMKSRNGRIYSRRFI